MRDAEYFLALGFEELADDAVIGPGDYFALGKETPALVHPSNVGRRVQELKVFGNEHWLRATGHAEKHGAGAVTRGRSK